MFELISKIADILLKATKAFQDWDDRDRRRRFGSSLATVYLRLLESITSGRRILRRLNYLHSKFETNASALPDNYQHLIDELCDDLHEQSINLRRAIDGFRHIFGELAVLAPEVDALLTTTAVGKMKRVDIVNKVLQQLGNGKISEVLLREGMTEDRGAVVDTKMDPADVIKGLANIDFGSGDASDEIAALELAAEEIRNQLTNNFKLEDILWSVSEFRYTDYK